MSNLGALVVRMVLDGLGAYKADLDKAAQTTSAGANKIEQATDGASKGITRMGGAMGGAAGTAVELAGAAGLAGAAAGALAAGIGLAAYAAFQGSKEQQAYNQALILTGNISGTTASQMQGMAAGIDAVVGTHYQAAEALTAMASTGQVAGQNLQTFAQVAVQAQRVVGTSVEDTAKVFAQLGEEPVKASIKLNQSMNYLTASTFAQIKAAQDLGDSETAASIAQNAYATAMAGRTEQIKANLGTLERAWIGVKDFAKEAWDAMLGLGRPTDPGKVLEEQSKRIATLRERLADKGLASNWGGADKLQAELDVLLQQQHATQEIVRMGRIGATAAAQRAASEKDKIAWMQEGEKYQSKQERLEGVIAAIRFKGAQAGATELEIEKRITVEREKAASKPGRADNSAARELEKRAALMATLSGVNADYLQQLERLGRERDQTNMSEERYVELVTELIAKQPMAKKLMDDATRADALAAKQMGESNAEYVKGLEALDKSIEKLQSETEKELAKAAALGLTKVAAADLAALELERDADALDRRANTLIALELEGETTKKYQEQAKALRDLAAAKRGTALRETELETEKEISAERKRGWEETDRLAREVFVNQEISAQRVGDVLKKALKSAMYEATLKPLVFQMYTSAVGGGGAGGGGIGGAIGSGVSNALGLAGVGSAFSGAASAGYALAAGGNAMATMGAGASMVGSATGFTSAAAGLGQMAGAAASGVSAALAAIPGWGWAAMAVLAIANMKGEYVQSLGESVATVKQDRLVSLGGSGGNNDVSIGGGLNIRQTDVSDKFVSSLADTYLKATQALGLKSSATFGAGFNNSDGGKFAVEVNAGGRTYDPGQIKTSDANLALEASRAVFFALQSSELPGYLSKVFDGITASTAAQADIDAALTYAGSLKQIRDALTETREPLQILKDTIADSFASLGTSADTFKTDFVAAIDAGISPDKLAQYQQLGANLDALAQSSNTTADAVRSLTDIANERKSLDERFAQATLTEVQLLERTRNALDESNRARFDEVLAAEKAKDAFANNAAEILRVAGTLASQQTKNPLLNTDPASISANAIKLGLTEGTLLETLNKIAADEKAAAEARFAQKRTENYAAAAEAFSRQMRGTVAVGSVNFGQQSNVTSDRRALQDQLDELQLSAVEKAAKARAALDSESRGIFDQLEKAKAVKTAAEEAARALEKFNGAMKGLTDTNTDLQAQLLKLQGDDAGSAQLLRNKALAALTQGVTTEDAARLTAQYDANEALKAQIEGLTQAQQDAASAAANLKSTWASITTGLMKEVDRIRGVIAASSEDSYAALESRFAIATAQARAGDLNAAGNLTSYSGQLSSAINEQAGSRSEMVRLQAKLAQSLQDTAVVLGSPVSPVNTPPVLNTEKLEASVAALTLEINSLKAQLGAIKTNTLRAADAADMLVAIAK